MVEGAALAQAPEPEPERVQDADLLRLFEKATSHYDLGEYAEAIAGFKDLYMRSKEPALLFNLAQAFRLSGDCAKAIESYRHFGRLTNDDDRRRVANEYIERLRGTCHTETATPPEAPSLPPPPQAATAPSLTGHTATSSTGAKAAGKSPREAVQAPKPLSPSGMVRRLSWWGLGAGTVLAAVGGGLYLLNAELWQQWLNEDRIILAGRGSQSEAAWFERVEKNDRLLGTLRTRDRWALGLGITGAVVAAAAVTTLVLSGNETVTLSASPSRLALTLTFP